MYLYSFPGRSNSGYKIPTLPEMDPYPRYSHTRHKTELSQPSYDYNVLYGFGYEDRNQLCLKLEEERLANRRSRVIIEDLLQERRKMEEKEKEKILKGSHLTNRHGQAKKGKKQKLVYSPQQERTKNASYFQNTTSPQEPNKNKTKQQILKKLFNGQQVQKECTPIIKTILQKQSNEKDKIRFQAISTSPQRQKQKQKQRDNELQIMREQVAFLKQQLNQKNKMIIDYQCEIVRAQKSQKIKTEELNKQLEKQKQREGESQNRMRLSSKCVNVMANVKANKKHYNISNQYTMSVPSETQKIPQLMIDSVPKQQEPNRLQFSSSLAYSYSLNLGSKSLQSEIDLTLSTSQLPINSHNSSRVMTEQSCQTQTFGIREQDSQTTENYFEIIEKAYLEWVFEKDYRQMEQKKKAKESATPKESQ